MSKSNDNSSGSSSRSSTPSIFGNQVEPNNLMLLLAKTRVQREHSPNKAVNVLKPLIKEVITLINNTDTNKLADSIKDVISEPTHVDQFYSIALILDSLNDLAKTNELKFSGYKKFDFNEFLGSYIPSLIEGSEKNDVSDEDNWLKINNARKLYTGSDKFAETACKEVEAFFAEKNLDSFLSHRPLSNDKMGSGLVRCYLNKDHRNNANDKQLESADNLLRGAVKGLVRMQLNKIKPKTQKEDYDPLSILQSENGLFKKEVSVSAKSKNSNKNKKKVGYSFSDYALTFVGGGASMQYKAAQDRLETLRDIADNTGAKALYKELKKVVEEAAHPDVFAACVLAIENTSPYKTGFIKKSRKHKRDKIDWKELEKIAQERIDNLNEAIKNNNSNKDAVQMELDTLLEVVKSKGDFYSTSLYDGKNESWQCTYCEVYYGELYKTDTTSKKKLDRNSRGDSKKNDRIEVPSDIIPNNLSNISEGDELAISTEDVEDLNSNKENQKS